MNIAFILYTHGRSVLLGELLASAARYGTLEGWHVHLFTQGVFSASHFKDVERLPGFGLINEVTHMGGIIGCTNARVVAGQSLGAGERDTVLLLDDDFEFLPETDYNLAASNLKAGVASVTIPAGRSRELSYKKSIKWREKGVEELAVTSTYGGKVFSGSAFAELMASIDSSVRLSTASEDLLLTGTLYAMGYVNLLDYRTFSVHKWGSASGNKQWMKQASPVPLPMRWFKQTMIKTVGEARNATQENYIRRFGFAVQLDVLPAESTERSLLTALTPEIHEDHARNRRARWGPVAPGVEQAASASTSGA